MSFSGRPRTQDTHNYNDVGVYTLPAADTITNQCCCCFKSLFLLFILVFSLGMLIAPITIIIIEQQNSITQKFQLQSLTVSAFNISDSRLTANWNVNISTRNENKIVWATYRLFEVAIYHNRDYLSIGGVGTIPFDQPPKNQTFLNVRLNEYMRNISESIAIPMGRERDLGEIDFNVYIQARVSYETPIYLSYKGTEMIVVACKNVKVGFAPNSTKGTMIGPANICLQITEGENEILFGNP